MKKDKKIILVVAVLVVLVLGFRFVFDESEIVESNRSLPNGDLAESIPNESGEAGGQSRKSGKFDLSKKAHYHDPETTMYGIYNLAWMLEPFHPTPQEFQYIAQRMAGVREVKKKVGDDAFFTPKGRRQFSREVDKLDAILRKQLGKKRYERYIYTAAPPLNKTCYSDAWRFVTVNGLDESRAEDLRDLAIEYNREVRGMEIDGQTDIDEIDRWRHEWHDLSYDEKKAIKLSFMDRIRDDFGEGVLNDILAVSNDLFRDLDRAFPEDSYKTVWNDLPTRKRMEELYGGKFIDHSTSPEEQRQMKAHEKEMNALREKEAGYHRLLRKEQDAMDQQSL